MNYLGIDIGSGSCKSVVFNEFGQQQAEASREYDTIFSDDGGAELDSDEVIAKCLETIRECSQKVEPRSIIGIGISSQGEAFTAIGKDGRALWLNLHRHLEQPFRFLEFVLLQQQASHRKWHAGTWCSCRNLRVARLDQAGMIIRKHG